MWLVIIALISPSNTNESRPSGVSWRVPVHAVMHFVQPSCRRETLIRRYGSLKEMVRVILEIFDLFLNKRKFTFKRLRSAQYPCLIYIVQMSIILFTRKDVIINIWSNHDNSDYVLIVTIYVDFGYEWTIRTSFLSSFKNFKLLDLQLYCGCTIAVM
jgi:hypothetical protein